MSGRPHGSLLVWTCQWPSSQLLSSHQLSHNDSLWAYGITKSHRKQGLNYREREELSWCPSWSNSYWQGWSWGLVHCPSGNATNPIWRVLESSDGISYWTPLKSQYSNPKPNLLANQLWCIDFLTPFTPLIIPHNSLPSLSLLCHSKTDARFMQDAPKAVWSIPYVSVAFYPSLKTKFYCISFFKRVLTSRLHFLKFTSCGNQALVGCIPIDALAAHLNLKS